MTYAVTKLCEAHNKLFEALGDIANEGRSASIRQMMTRIAMLISDIARDDAAVRS